MYLLHRTDLKAVATIIEQGLQTALSSSDRVMIYTVAVATELWDQLGHAPSSAGISMKNTGWTLRGSGM